MVVLVLTINMPRKQWTITITLNKELYLELEERSKNEERTKSNLALYLLKKGLESEKQQ